MKKRSLLTSTLTASISTLAFASPPTLPPALTPSFRSSSFLALHPDAPGARPDGRADALNNTGAFNAVDALGDVTTSAGVHSNKHVVVPHSNGPIISLSGEYNYLTTNDTRLLGADTQTHSMTLGASVLLNGDLYLGVNYSYSQTDSALYPTGLFTNGTSNYISLVVAKSFMRFLSVGVAGGYGNTGYDLTGPAGRVTSASDMDSWSISPFVSATLKTGALTSSLTAMYQYETDETTFRTGGVEHDDTGKFSLALRSTYSASERLKLQAFAKYTKLLNGSSRIPGLPESRNWAQFGAKVSFYVSKPLEIYAGYAYDAFNKSLETHTVTGGMRYSF